MKIFLIVLIFGFNSLLLGQQQYFWSIGEVVPDSTTIHDYFNSKWQMEKGLNVKIIEVYDCNKKGIRKKLKSKEEFIPLLGIVKGKYFKYKKGKDFKIALYNYDSLGRLFNVDVETTITDNFMDLELFYNTENQVIKWIEGNRLIEYEYYEDGRKKWIKFTKTSSTSSSLVLFNYYYDRNGRMKGVIDENDSLQLYTYLNDTIHFNGYNNWTTSCIYSNDFLVETIDSSYTEDPSLFEIEKIKYVYDPKNLYIIEKKVKGNLYKTDYSSLIKYIYYDNGLIKAIIDYNSKGKITSYKEYEYTYH